MSGMYYPAGYSSEEEDSDSEFLVPSAVAGSKGVQRDDDWVPLDCLGLTNSNRTVREMNDSDRKVLDRTKKNVRAVLTAEKGELDLPSLEREYLDTFEEIIPWQSLNFPSLEELLLSIPSVCEVRNTMFSTYVTAVLDQNTQHIRQLVNYQKNSKKKGGRGRSRGHWDLENYLRPGQFSWADSLSFGTELERTESNLQQSELSWGDSPSLRPELERTESPSLRPELERTESPSLRPVQDKTEEMIRSLEQKLAVSQEINRQLEEQLDLAKKSMKKMEERVEELTKLAHTKTQERTEERTEEGTVEGTVEWTEERTVERTDSNSKVWLGRLKELLTGRNFGLLVQHVERSYEREWGETLPRGWRDLTQLIDQDIVFVDDCGSSVSWVKLV